MEDKINNDLDKNTIQIDLKRLFLALIKRSWIIILVSVLCAGISLLYTYYFVKPKYVSSAVFYVNNSSISIGNSVSITDLNAAKSLVDSYMVILESRSSLNDVIDYAELDYSVDQLRSMISAAPINNTEIFQVAVISENPYEAERIANSIAHILPNKITTIIEGTSAKIVDYAIIPHTPYSPNYMSNTSTGFIVGLVISALLILLIEIFDIRVHTQDDIEQTCSLPVLASVPDMFTQSNRKGYYRSAYAKSAEKHTQDTSQQRVKSNLIGKNLTFDAAEANKVLRTKLLFSFTDSSSCHVVGVSSAMVGEGKSLSSINLAYSMSQLNKRVLVIDCDLRRPSIYKKLKFRRSIGLTELLTGQCTLSEIIQTYTESDDSASFDVIISGETPPNPMELLSSDRMREVLDSLRPSYDYIIIDLPPIGEVGDALAVSKVIDGMLIIVRQNYCTRTALSSAIKQFNFVGARILGIVFNCTVDIGYRYKYHSKYYGKYYKPRNNSTTTK